MASMREFFSSFEQLRNCEKSLIAKGFQEKLFKKKINHYVELAKLFVQRSVSEAVESIGPNSLLDRPEPKSVAKNDQTTQTEVASPK